MKSLKLFSTGLKLLATGLLYAYASSSLAIICVGDNRTAEVDPSSACTFSKAIPPGPFPDPVELEAWMPSSDGWFNKGVTKNGRDSHRKLTVDLTSGSWGDSSVAGNWEIKSNFWNVFDQGIISIHVGHGGGDPDWFAFLIDEGATSGMFSYGIDSGRGGGLSNIRLWGAREPTSGRGDVPEPSVILLFGAGLIGFGLVRRKVKA